MRKVVPKAALYSLLTGVGFVYLAFNPMLSIAAEPVMCLVPLLVVLVGFFGKTTYKIGNTGLTFPIALLAIILSMVFGWAGACKKKNFSMAFAPTECGSSNAAWDAGPGWKANSGFPWHNPEAWTNYSYGMAGCSGGADCAKGYNSYVFAGAPMPDWAPAPAWYPGTAFPTPSPTISPAPSEAPTTTSPTMAYACSWRAAGRPRARERNPKGLFRPRPERKLTRAWKS